MSLQESLINLKLQLEEEADRFDPEKANATFETVYSNGKRTEEVLERRKQVSIYLATRLLRCAIAMVCTDRSPESLEELYFNLKDFLRGHGFYAKSPEAFKAATALWERHQQTYSAERMQPVYHVFHHAHAMLDQLMTEDEDEPEEADQDSEEGEPDVGK
jgi:hypothetical protein